MSFATVDSGWGKNILGPELPDYRPCIHSVRKLQPAGGVHNAFLSKLKSFRVN